MKENRFKSIEDLNATVRAHRHRNVLSRSERAVLNLLSQYSCKTIGESFLAKSTIAELIGKSRRTIIRICNRLESLGIIRQDKRMRETGDRRQTSNLIVILPIEIADVTPECHSEEAPQLNSKSINNTKERTAKPAWIPQSFYNLVSAHHSDVETIEEYWRAAYATTYTYNFTAATKVEIAIDAFYVMKGKRKKLRNPLAFFVGVIKRQAKKRYVTEMFNDYFSEIII
ncbi:helix-turn-helix domain-containing protein [Niallia taxi]|uniref:Helix-turn-helix domain-containing protein n=1 Tax=Niallia taxi TaxID=2499688 RepID=A0A3S2X8Z4_9BACI|nr:helix-turn-helix domain-containing protein [Niallia taxi]RVT62772.1 helix-turn-helix domain-containing protein [Niallia taxi]